MSEDNKGGAVVLVVDDDIIVEAAKMFCDAKSLLRYRQVIISNVKDMLKYGQTTLSPRHPLYYTVRQAAVTLKELTNCEVTA